MKNFILDDVKRLIETALLEEPTGDPFVDARYREQIELVGHTQPYYRLFWHIAREFRPGFTVELGAWQATAAAHFASGNPDGVVVTIDHHTDPGDEAHKARAMEAAQQYPNLLYFQGWTWDVVGDVKAVGRPIEVLFIDSWHDKRYAIRDWASYSPLLADSALVICDDILPDDPSLGDGMVQFWQGLSSVCDGFLDARLHPPGIPMGFLKFSR